MRDDVAGLLRYGGELCLACVTFNAVSRIGCARSLLPIKFLDDDMGLLHSYQSSLASTALTKQG